MYFTLIQCQKLRTSTFLSVILKFKIKEANLHNRMCTGIRIFPGEHVGTVHGIKEEMGLILKHQQI